MRVALVVLLIGSTACFTPVEERYPGDWPESPGAHGSPDAGVRDASCPSPDAAADSGPGEPPPSCPHEALTWCDDASGGRCTKLEGDAQNCGACGRACTPDEACQGSECVRVHARVFVSSETYTGNLGGLAGADEKCRRLAEAAGLGSSFKAWLSLGAAGAGFRFRTVPGRRYWLVDQTYVGTLVSTLEHAIDRDEWGRPAPPSDMASDPNAVWSNSSDNVGCGPSCGGWTSDSGDAVFGIRSRTDNCWSCCGVVKSGCWRRAPIYCVED